MRLAPHPATSSPDPSVLQVHDDATRVDSVVVELGQAVTEVDAEYDVDRVVTPAKQNARRGNGGERINEVL